MKTAWDPRILAMDISKVAESIHNFTGEGHSEWRVAYFTIHLLNYVFLLNVVIIVGRVYKFSPNYSSSHLTYALLFVIMNLVYTIVLYVGLIQSYFFDFLHFA